MTQEIDIEKYHQLALQKQKEHRKVLANLKKKPPKNLDKIVQEIHDEVFQEIDCTACANCCKTLGFLNPCLAPFLVGTISVPSMMFDQKLVGNSLTPIARRFIRSTI